MNLKLTITVNEKGVSKVEIFPDKCFSLHFKGDGDPAQVKKWVEGYLLGKSLPIPPLDLASFPTKYSQKVCLALQEVGYGECMTYGELAKKIDSSPRPVGGGLSRNPFPLLLPCHRIVAYHGIGGFSCGLDVKRELLRVENLLIQI
jgi:methylated-DNA-[protein]-cysteine S-methyltransferase